jgi:hypothetical protein
MLRASDPDFLCLYVQTATSPDGPSDKQDLSTSARVTIEGLTRARFTLFARAPTAALVPAPGAARRPRWRSSPNGNSPQSSPEEGFPIETAEERKLLRGFFALFEATLACPDMLR